MLVYRDHFLQIAGEVEGDQRERIRISPRGIKMESAHPMATAQGYYPTATHQGMYTHRNYSQAQYHAYGQTSCAYGGKPVSPMGYGSEQTMSVVDQYGLHNPGDTPGSAAGLSAHSFTLAAAAALQGHQAAQHPSHHHLPAHHLNGSALAQTFTHQQLRSHLTESQPPPAHNQNHLLHQTRRPDGKLSPATNGSRSPVNGNQNSLHFPWMKTTKSHAHQWKAGWSGWSINFSFLFLIYFICRQF